MKKVIKVILITFFSLFVIVGAVLAYHGYFSTYEIYEKEVGPYTFATKRFVGDYYKVGPTMTEVDNELREIGVLATKGVGIFYDDPSVVPEDQLRSDVGNVLEDVSDAQLAEIGEKFDVKNIDRQTAVVVDFPIKSSLSYMIAPMKVYPLINQYWEEKNYPAQVIDGYSMEIYDIEGKVTRYIMPIPAK